MSEFNVYALLERQTETEPSRKKAVPLDFISGDRALFQISNLPNWGKPPNLSGRDDMHADKWEGAREMIVKTTILIIIKPKKLTEMSQRCPVFGKSTNIRVSGQGGGAELDSRHPERSPELRVPKEAGRLYKG